MKSYQLFVVVGAVTAVVALSGCGTKEPEEPGMPADAKPGPTAIAAQATSKVTPPGLRPGSGKGER